jgi:hypothetical protein
VASVAGGDDATYYTQAVSACFSSTVNVVNKVLPLIRYELGEEIVLEPPEEGDGAGGPVVAEVRGRDHDTFVYLDVVARRVGRTHRAPHRDRPTQGRDRAAF